MNYQVILIELIVMIILFTIITFGMLLINPLSFISDYPPEIQAQYYKSQNKQETKEKLTVLMKIKKIVAIIVFIFILAYELKLAGCKSFIDGFLLSLFYIFIIFAWDTFVLDWLLFPNIKRVRY